MENPKTGTLVALCDAPDSCIFIVGRQHHTYKKLYELTYYTANGRNANAGFNDCSLFQTPTQQQFADADNSFTVQHA